MKLPESNSYNQAHHRKATDSSHQFDLNKHTSQHNDMERPEPDPKAITSNVGKPSSTVVAETLSSEELHKTTYAEDQNDGSLPEYVALDSTTIDSFGRRSMAYLHQPTGKIVAETDRHDDEIPEQILRDASRRDDVLRCWALCEHVRPQLLRNALRYLVQPLYWFALIVSLLILFWETNQQHKELNTKEPQPDKSSKNEYSAARTEDFGENSGDEDLSDLMPLEKTALDTYGRRSMAFGHHSDRTHRA